MPRPCSDSRISGSHSSSKLSRPTAAAARENWRGRLLRVRPVGALPRVPLVVAEPAVLLFVVDDLRERDLPRARTLSTEMFAELLGEPFEAARHDGRLAVRQ